jgi:hypothetical protein
MGTEEKMHLHNGSVLTCEAGLQGMKTRSMTKMLAESPEDVGDDGAGRCADATGGTA